MVHKCNFAISSSSYAYKQGCSVERIDRDTSAATNITMIFARQLLGLPHPVDLERPVSRAQSGSELNTVLGTNQSAPTAPQQRASEGVRLESAADAADY